MGAWIEIYAYENFCEMYDVAPLVGAWIEMGTEGVKVRHNSVAPLVGAWIEINVEAKEFALGFRRSPCGSVD